MAMLSARPLDVEAIALGGARLTALDLSGFGRPTSKQALAAGWWRAEGEGGGGGGGGGYLYGGYDGGRGG